MLEINLKRALVFFAFAFACTKVAQGAELTAKRASDLLAKTRTPTIIRVEKEIVEAATKGRSRLSVPDNFCGDLEPLARKGFKLHSSCAPMEYGGKCTCEVSW